MRRYCSGMEAIRGIRRGVRSEISSTGPKTTGQDDSTRQRIYRSRFVGAPFPVWPLAPIADPSVGRRPRRSRWRRSSMTARARRSSPIPAAALGLALAKSLPVSDGIRFRKSCSHQTPRWRERDSNPRSPSAWELGCRRKPCAQTGKSECGVSGSGCGPVSKYKSRRRAQGLVNHAETLAHLDQTLHRRGIGVGV